jgi:cytochrome P450
MESNVLHQQKSMPPKAEGGWPIGSARLLVADPLDFFEKFIPKYGGIFQITSVFVKVMRQFDWIMVVSNPDMVKNIMQDNNRNYVKSHSYKVLEILLGHGLLTSEGDFWRKQRRLIQPAFHKDRMAAFVNIMATAAEEMVANWKKLPDVAEVNVSKDMMGMTLDIVCRAMFGTDVSDAMDVVNREFDKANEMLITRIKGPVRIPIYWPTLGNYRERKTYDAIKKVVSDIIDKRRKSTERYDDLLAMLMEVQDEETGERMSDNQIQDEVITIFLAGHETTAVALSWLMLCLDQNPEVEAKLKEEAERVLRGASPRMEHLRELEYTRMVIDETLRLYPPAWVIGRQSIENDEMGGYHVPKRTNCIIPVYYIHRDPLHWENPEQFIPERFNKQNSVGRHKFVYFPFGGGPRLCIGNSFAIMEMQIIVATIVQQVQVRKSKELTIKKEPLITMRPSPHLRMNLVK